MIHETFKYKINQESLSHESSKMLGKCIFRKMHLKFLKYVIDQLFKPTLTSRRKRSSHWSND